MLCAKAHKVNYLPYGAILRWNTSANIEIDSQAGDSIRVNMIKGSTGTYWIEAVVNVNGKQYSKRKTLTPVVLENIELTHMASDYNGPNGTHRAAIFVFPSGINNIGLFAHPEYTQITWSVKNNKATGSFPIIGNEAKITTEGRLGNTSMPYFLTCLKTHIPTIEDTTITRPPWNTNKTGYTLINPSITIDPLNPVDALNVADHRCKAIITLPNKDYEGTVSCAVVDYCGNWKIAKYFVSHERCYPITTSSFAAPAPDYSISPSPASNYLQVKRTEQEQNTFSEPYYTPIKLVLSNEFGTVRIIETTIEKDGLQLDVNDLPNGMYYLNIIKNGNITNRQTVIIAH